MRNIREAKFEYDAIKEVLEEDDLPIAKQMEMQHRMCELILEIREIRREQAADPSNQLLRKNPVKKYRKVTEEDMTDYRAFKHFLENPENIGKYKKSTLASWRNALKNGKTPAAVAKILRFAGYVVVTERKWRKPKSRTRKK